MTRPRIHAHPRSWQLIVLVAATLSSACTKQGPASTEPAPTPVAVDPAAAELAARLAYLDAELEQARVSSHVPGMAIAIVADGEVIFAKGYGVADLDSQRPVTPETGFAIGSTTKAFTSTLVGMLVDDGTMDWDAPASSYLPGFELAIDSPDEGAQATVRDLLSHRAGFARMGLLWIAGTISRARVLEYATKAEPVAGLGKEFHYCNVTYMAAGEASAKVAGTDWESLLQTRLFDPLRMTTSTTDYAIATADPGFAKGYRWREDLNRLDPLPMRDLQSIGPAGSINSNVLDMTHWLEFQLANGEFDGARLISSESLAQTRTAQIEIAPGISYGMGWMLREWEGREVVEHGGNIDGFSASVAMLPSEGLGMVLLMNKDNAGLLQGAGHTMVWKALLTDVYRQEADAGSGEDFGKYVGKYVAELPGFEGKLFEVTVDDGVLAVDVPGQKLFRLEAPDEDGWRSFVEANEIAISFDEDPDGAVIALRLHQSGFDFELLREGVVLEPEVDAAEVADLLGTYEGDEVPLTVEILIHHGRLAVEIVGHATFDLELPDSSGAYHFRAKADRFVSFRKGKQGGREQVTGLTLFEPGKTPTFTKLASKGDKSIPTLEALDKRRRLSERTKAIAKAGTTVLHQVIRHPSAGVEGHGTLWFDTGGQWRHEQDYGEIGSGITVLGEAGGWSESSFQPFERTEGKLLAQARLAHPMILLGDWRDHYDEITVLAPIEREGERLDVVRLRAGELPPLTLYLDAKTGDIVESHGAELVIMGIEIPVVTQFSDYREVGGLRIPYRIETRNSQTGRSEVILESVEFGVADEPGRFAPR